MSAAADILKNFQLFVDGRGFAGNADEIQLPSLTSIIEDFRAGGLDSTLPIEMGQEKMEASWTLSKFDSDTLALWGVAPGSTVPVVARGALESFATGTVTPIVARMAGRIRSIEPGAWKAGEKPTLKITMDVTAYTYTQNGRTIHDIDVLNMKRIINGVDRLAAQRAAIGL
jgi:P2 family phage contractile tail tube protein